MLTEPPRLRDLVGLPLWAIGRAADLQWFQFGEKTLLAATAGPRKGQLRAVGDFALHLQCPWRLRIGDRLLVGDYDLRYPRDVTSLEDLPEDFDMKPGSTRLDQLVEHVHGRFLPAIVQQISPGPGGSFTMRFQDRLCLDVFPNATVETEFWRLFVPSNDQREHFVVESLGTKVPTEPSSESECSPLFTGPYRAAHASVRFMGEALDPLEVAKRLRLPCDHSHRKDEPNVKRNRVTGAVLEYSSYRQGLWSMSSENFVRSDELDKHVLWLLAQLEPLSHEIAGLLALGIEGDIFCYSLGDTPNPPTLPDTTTVRATALGLTIEIDHYDASEDDD